jgi:putative holliday junction resolvase
VGDRYIGVAVSDPLGIIARPLTILERGQPGLDCAAVACLAGKYEVERVVAGLPRLSDGTLGSQAEKVALFVDQLFAQTGLSVVYQDERFSSAAAQSILKTRRRRPAAPLPRDDALAAAIILQDYLDEHRA